MSNNICAIRNMGLPHLRTSVFTWLEWQMILTKRYPRWQLIMIVWNKSRFLSILEHVNLLCLSISFKVCFLRYHLRQQISLIQVIHKNVLTSLRFLGIIWHVNLKLIHFIIHNSYHLGSERLQWSGRHL